MTYSFTLTTEIKAPAEKIYKAWLNSNEHAKMTEAESAIASHNIGDIFKAHGEYIFGKNIELVPNKKIVQTWRTVEFLDTEPDSLLEIIFEENDSKTKITLKHTNVSNMKYKQGWIDYYFVPMKNYFEA